MAEPKVSILLTLVDKMTAPVEGARSAIGKFGASLKGLGTEAIDLLNNKLIQGIGFAGMVTGLGKAFEASDRFRNAAQALEGTAKITGVSIDWLKGIAEDAGKKFGLSKVQASEFAIEMAKLATKAGDVGAAGPALEAFLNIGAARGLTAAQTLKAVQQAILGIDEGTDKLFNANPSVLYAMFAEQIGTTAGKLTDQEKAQALLTIAMDDGAKVMGQYAAWQETAAGKAAMAANAADQAAAQLGDALVGLRSALADAKSFGADLLTGIVQVVQLAGEWIGAAFLMVPLEIKLLWESLLVGVASGIEQLGKIIPFVGDKIEEAGRTMLAKHRAAGQVLMAQMEEYKGFHEAAQADILGIDIDGAQARYDAALSAADKAKEAAKKAEEEKRKAAERAAAAAKKADEQSHKDLAKLQKLYDDQSITSLESHQLAYAELVAAFQEKMKGMNADDREKAQAILDKHAGKMLDIWNKQFGGMEATMVGFTKGPMRDLTTSFETLPIAVGPTVSTFDRVKDVAGELGQGLRDAANEMGAFANALGVSDPQLEKTLQGVSQLGGALQSLAAGDTIGAISGGIAGLSAIIGGIFGDSPEAKARKALIQKNTERLAELRDTMGALLTSNTPGGKLAGLASIKPEDLAAETLPWGPRGQGKLVSRSALGQFLRGKGVTLTDFVNVAKDLGIDLGENGNYFDSDMVRQFIESIGTQQLTGFDNSLSGNVKRSDWLVGITGGSAGDSLAGIGAALSAGNGSSALGGLFEGINLGDGIDATEAAIIRGRTIGLAGRFAGGGVSATEMGGASNSEFMSFITTIIGYLDTIAGATGATAGAVTSGGIGTVADTDMATSIDLSTVAVGG